MSEPIVQFRETVIQPPKMDMVNEAIVESEKVIYEIIPKTFSIYCFHLVNFHHFPAGIF